MEQVGVRVEESEVRPGAGTELPFEGVRFRDFAVTGAQASGDFRCADCGYGAVVQRLLPRCPMCGGTIWECRGPLAPRLD